MLLAMNNALESVRTHQKLNKWMNKLEPAHKAINYCLINTFRGLEKLFSVIYYRIVTLKSMWLGQWNGDGIPCSHYIQLQTSGVTYETHVFRPKRKKRRRQTGHHLPSTRSSTVVTSLGPSLPHRLTATDNWKGSITCQGSTDKRLLRLSRRPAERLMAAYADFVMGSLYIKINWPPYEWICFWTVNSIDLYVYLSGKIINLKLLWLCN